VPGFIELLRFRSEPSRVEGRALVVRLSGSDSYALPNEPDDSWVYRPDTRRFERKAIDLRRGNCR